MRLLSLSCLPYRNFAFRTPAMPRMLMSDSLGTRPKVLAVVESSEMPLLPVSRIKLRVSELPNTMPFTRMTLSAANKKDTVVSGWDGGGINSSCACTPAATKVVATNQGLIIGKAFIAMPLRSFTKGTIIPLILLSITCAFPSVGRNPYLHPRFNAYPMTEYNAFGGGLQQPGENHPITSLILLLALVFAGAIVFCVLSVFIGLMVTNGSAGIGNLGGFLSGNTANATFLKIVQGGSSIGMFVFPSLLMGIIEKRQRPYLDFKAPVNPQLWFILLGIMFFSAP